MRGSRKAFGSSCAPILQVPLGQRQRLLEMRPTFLAFVEVGGDGGATLGVAGFSRVETGAIEVDASLLSSGDFSR
jgi:hypothetical protein